MTEEPTAEATEEPTAEATEEPVAPPTPQPITDAFSDDFQASGAANWVLDGWEMSAEGPNLFLLSTKEDAVASIDGLAWPHFLLSLQAHIPAGTSLSFTLRNSYVLTVTSEGQASLYRDGTLLAEGTGSVGANWRTINVQALGGMFTVAVDRIAQFSYTDPNPVTTGGLVFGADTAGVGFDDVSINRLDAPEITPEPIVEPTAIPTEPPVAASSLQVIAASNFDGSGDNMEWTLRPGWEIVSINNGQALQVSNTTEAADFGDETFVDGTISARLKFDSGTVYLKTHQRMDSSGYAVALSATGQVSLAREGAVVATGSVSINPGQWHALAFSVQSGALEVTVDGALALAYTDGNPLPAGWLSFVAPDTRVIDETQPASTALIDNVAIETASVMGVTPLVGVEAPSGQATIGDYIWLDVDGDGYQDASESGVAGITVNLYRGNGSSTTSGTFVASTVTNASGFYQFTVNVVSSYYFVEIDLPRAYILTNPNASSDSFDSDIDPITRRMTSGTYLTSTEDDTSVDAGLIPLQQCTSDTPLDIMLVLDGSGSISSSDYVLMQNFSIGLVNSFNISKTEARFGIVQFAAERYGKVEVPLGDKRGVLIDRLTNLRRLANTGWTDIQEGIYLGQREFDKHGRNRSQVPRAMIVLTDGYHNVGNPSPESEAQKAKKKSTLIYGVAVGVADLTQIRAIASDPDSRFVFSIDNFAGLVQSLNQISESTCNTPLRPYERPNLLQIPNRQYTNDNTPTLNWTAVSFTESRFGGYYEVVIDNGSSMRTPERAANINGTTWILGSPLPDGRYFWRVRGANVAGNGPWSAKWQFIVDTVPPDVPSLRAPWDGSSISTLRPSFSWSRSRGASNYQIQVDDNANFSSPVFDESPRNTRFRAPSNLGQGTYYWRVRAYDRAGNVSAWSAVSDFVTNLAISPQNGSFVLANKTTDVATPGFRWGRALGAVNYQLIIANNSAFSSIRYQTTTNKTSLKLPSTDGLPFGTYYWRVLVDYGSGFVSTGVYSSFTVTPEKPGRPRITAPSNGEVLSTNPPTVTWDAVPYSYGALTYQVQIDNNSNFSSPEYSTTTASTSYTPGAALTSGRWYIRVLAINQYGYAGLWSSRVSVRVP
ncbi:MAG: VWA domain-containing protein [Anaerolineae bacterium]|nr:VWA domain-containing protein [Anaerolineae bacterium]